MLIGVPPFKEKQLLILAKSEVFNDIASVIRKNNELDFYFSDNLVHKCRKQLSIKSETKHYQYKKLGDRFRA